MDLNGIKEKLKLCGTELRSIKEDMEAGEHSDLLLERAFDLIGIHIDITNDMATYLMMNNGHYSQEEIIATPFPN